MTVVLFKSGSVKAYDDKWQKYEREYDQKTDALGNKIAELDPKQASSLRLPRSGADDFTGT